MPNRKTSPSGSPEPTVSGDTNVPTGDFASKGDSTKVYTHPGAKRFTSCRRTNDLDRLNAISKLWVELDLTEILVKEIPPHRHYLLDHLLRCLNRIEGDERDGRQQELPWVDVVED